MRPGPTRSSLLAEHRVVTAGWVALALLAVHLAAAIPVRLDLTRDGRYALSDAAREVVGGLDREVIANVYFTAPLDPPYHTHEAAVLDLLAELDAASGGAIRVTVADPGDDPAIRDQAAALGVTPVPYTLRTRDRVEARSVYLGVAITAGDRTVAIPALPSIPRMEYELVRAIRAVTTDPDDRPTIGWWLGHGEADPATAPAGSPLRTVRERLAERGTVRTVTGGDVPIPDDVDLLVIAAPRDPVSAVETVHLDQFVMRGGRVLVFASSFRIDFARGAPVPVDHGLYAWLGGLGVRANRDLLLDRTHNEVLAVPIGDRWVKVNHPLAPTTANLDRGEPAVRSLPSLVLPVASSLAVADPLPPGVEVAVWASTDADAGSVKGLVTLDPSVLGAKLSSETPGPFPVVVAVSGTPPSLFAERPLPDREDPEAAPFDRAALRSVADPTRVVVVSSADAVANDLDLVANAVDWLVEDPVLIGIRSRADVEPPLPAPSVAAAARIRAALVGIPLAVLGGIGLVASRRRR